MSDYHHPDRIAIPMYMIILFVVMLGAVLFALWWNDAPIMGGTTEPDCAVETAGCYESLMAIKDDANACSNELAECRAMVEAAQINERTDITPTPDSTHTDYCDQYMILGDTEEWLIETSEDFLIVSLIQMARAVNLSSCSELDEKYYNEIIYLMFNAHELQTMYLDENMPDWLDRLDHYLEIPIEEDSL